MKFSQLILLLIIVNLINVIVGFSLASNDISDFEDTIFNWFSAENGFQNQVNTFESKATDSDSFAIKIVAEVMQGISQAINLVIISVQIILLVIWGWITPAVLYYEFFTNSNELTFFKFIGLFAYIYIQWFNIMIIIRLVKVIKGSDN